MALAARFPELAGRLVLVTGARQGIGAAIAEAFAQQDARVVRADLAYEGALGAEPDQLTAHLDVSDETSVAELFEQISSRKGTVDVVVNAAGISTMNFVAESNLADWERTNAVNARGSYLIARAAARQMLSSGTRGRIVLIASQAAKNGYRAMGAYVASKHAVLGLTKTLAIELAPSGITVNAICPGIIETAMKHRERVDGARLRGLTPEDIEREDASQVPLGRTGQPEDVAGVALFLASGLGSYLTGQGINVTGGMTMH